MTTHERAAASTAQRRRWRPHRRELRRQITSFSFVLPALILMAIFLFYPIGYLIWLAFEKWDLLGTPVFVGFHNFYNIIFGPFSSDFMKSVGVTVLFVILAMPAQVGLGLFLAVILERELKGKAFFRSTFFFPMVISFVAAGITFKWLFDNQLGMIPAALASAGIPFPNWHADGTWGVIIIVITNTWKVAGFSMILYIAGLEGISNDLYEAAEIDGVRSAWQRFRFISWPLIVPTTALLVITNTIGSFQAFVPFFVMTTGGPGGDTTSIVYYIYNNFASQTGLASAAATLFLIAVLAITAVQLSIARQREQVY